MRKIITIKDADVLIEKYYEGLTTLAEEKQLNEFLSQKNIPARFDTEKAMFGFFANQKAKPKGNKIQMLRWASVAAVFITMFFSTGYLFSQNDKDYAYIDGKVYTDVNIVKNRALASINDIAGTNDEVKTSAGLLQDNQDLIEQQLSLFDNLQ